MIDDEDDNNESVKDILERIVSKPEYKDKRARQLDLDDFLQLLSDFHDEGVYFTSWYEKETTTYVGTKLE